MNKEEFDLLYNKGILNTIYKQIDFNSINWLDNPFSHNSYIFALHNMDYLIELLNYIKTNNMTIVGGYEFCYKILNSWKDACYNDRKSKAYHDHATAIRAVNIAKIYQSFIKETSLDEDFKIRFAVLLQDLLLLHAKILSEDSFYSRFTNHGFDQSLALYELSFALNDKELAKTSKNLALAHIKDELNHAFCDDGTHIENSPAYLKYGIIQAQRAYLLILKLDGETIASFFLNKERFLKSLLLLGFLTQPNTFLPLIGDTATVKSTTNLEPSLVANSKEYQHYLYFSSGGKMGLRCEKQTLVCQKSGYVIIRDDECGFDESLHFVFKCMYLSNYHRHDDDTSFTLFYDKEEWLLDSGLFEYAEKDPLRLYLRSFNAHNLSSPLIKAHRVLEKGKNTGVFNCSEDDKKLSFVGKSFMFDGFLLERAVNFDKKMKIFSFNDKIKPLNNESLAFISNKIKANERTYSTRFIIPNNKKVIVDTEKKLITIQGQRVSLIIAFRSDISVRLVKGNENPIQGFISRKMSQKEKVNFLEINHFSQRLDIKFDMFFVRNENEIKKYQNYIKSPIKNIFKRFFKGFKIKL